MAQKQQEGHDPLQFAPRLSFSACPMTPPLFARVPWGVLFPRHLFLSVGKKKKRRKKQFVKIPIHPHTHAKGCFMRGLCITSCLVASGTRPPLVLSSLRWWGVETATPMIPAIYLPHPNAHIRRDWECRSIVILQLFWIPQNTDTHSTRVQPAPPTKGVSCIASSHSERR